MKYPSFPPIQIMQIIAEVPKYFLSIIIRQDIKIDYNITTTKSQIFQPQMNLILTYTKSHPCIWVHSSPSFLFPTEIGQHYYRDSEIVRVMQASHYAVIHLRYVTKTLILGGESDAKPGTRCWERWVSATHHCGDRGENPQNLTISLYVFEQNQLTSGNLFLLKANKNIYKSILISFGENSKCVRIGAMTPLAVTGCLCICH